MSATFDSRLSLQTLSGPDSKPWAEQMAALRIRVFREFPYLYDGDEEYEQKYLRVYFDCPQSVCVLLLNGDELVGVSTGLPLVSADASFLEPFRAAGIDPDKVFYFGESVLLPSFRGQGLGRAFFDHRETWVRRLGGFRWTGFCAVDRPEDHAARPENYRPLDRFWKARGYQKRPDLRTTFSWKQVGQTEESAQHMTFWIREL